MAVPSFLIKHGSVDFLNKQKNLFDVLNAVEKETKPEDSCYGNFDELMEIEQKSRKRKRKETKPFRGKESLFKEPIEISMKFKKPHQIPDFQKNPGKWVKYSLADITQDDMSNEMNTTAALSFLQEIKMQKKLACTKIKPEDRNDNKPTPTELHKFHLPKQDNIKKEQVSTDEVSCKPVFKNNKLIMPEYVVGLVKKEKKRKQNVTKEKGKEIYLNHIYEYPDE